MRTLSWSMDVELDPPAAHEEHVQTCEECDRPGELLAGLCHRCRCHGCGDPAAPVELDERRLCMACAIDLGWTRPLELVLEAAE